MKGKLYRCSPAVFNDEKHRNVYVRVDKIGSKYVSGWNFTLQKGFEVPIDCVGGWELWRPAADSDGDSNDDSGDGFGEFDYIPRAEAQQDDQGWTELPAGDGTEFNQVPCPKRTTPAPAMAIRGIVCAITLFLFIIPLDFIEKTMVGPTNQYIEA
ncbi:MAG: hypothetical protein OIF34_03855, partial [Porticoccaceae bacterium]|nr:hypothetical protein [Porticoccaceae bacterium]